MSEPKKFTLYWSSLSMFEDCPQQFLWSKGWGSIDLGRGPGRGKEKPLRKSEHHAILGIAIQGAIERFYNDELWKTLPPVDLRERLLQIGEELLKVELARKFVDWNKANMTREDMEILTRDALLGFLRTLKAHRFLGPYAKAEVELLAYINKYNPVGGRADIILRRDDTGVTILDTKNSKRYKDPKNKTKWMTYTDPDQLRWYAMLYYLCYHKLPERLGFVFFRYPYGDPVKDVDGVEIPGQTETGVDWVPVTLDDIKGLAQRSVDARIAMGREKFAADPSPPKCRMCDFETVCPERQAQIAANRRTPKAADPFAGQTGWVTLGFGTAGSKSVPEEPPKE